MALKELREELAAKRDALHGIFTTYNDGTGGLKEMPMDVIEDVRRRNEELGEIGAKLQSAEAMESAFKANTEAREEFLKARGQSPFSGAGGDPSKDEQKEEKFSSLGDMFVKSPEFGDWKKGRRQGQIAPLALELKTTMTTAAGWVQESRRTGRVVETALRRPMVQDLMPNTQTDLDTPGWMEETTFTNNAAPVAEAAAKPESALAYTARTQPAEVIATILPVTEQQLDAEAQMRSLIENRMTRMLDLATETQILTGDGVTPNLLGFLNKPGIATQALGADTVPDAIYKAMAKVRDVAFAEPTAYVTNPADWTPVRLLKDTTGQYIWGNPSVAGVETIFGLRAVITTAMTENTGLVGDFAMYSELFERWGVRIDIGWINDNFSKNIRTLRIERRCALAIYRAAAFCTVTGI